MTTRIERIQLPESAQLRRALVARADSVHPGARVVDADMQGPTGVDLLFVDDDGRPVFVDVVLDSAGEVPTRIFDHTRWYEQNRRLFLKAYTNDGVVRIEDPVFVFVASRFPASVLDVVRAMPEVPVRLVRAEYFLIDGAAEVLLEDVTPSVQARISTSVARTSSSLTPCGRCSLSSDRASTVWMAGSPPRNPMEASPSAWTIGGWLTWLSPRAVSRCHRVTGSSTR